MVGLHVPYHLRNQREQSEPAAMSDAQECLSDPESWIHHLNCG